MDSSAQRTSIDTGAMSLSGLTESGYLQQLRHGFRWLQFGAPLEKEFRAHYTEQVRWRVVGMMLLLIGFALYKGYATMAQGAEPHPAAPGVYSHSRTLLLMPVALALLVTGLVGPAYRRWWAAVGPFCLMAAAVLVAPGASAKVAAGNYHVFLSLALGLFQIYALAGFLFWPTVLVSIVVSVSYMLALLDTALPPSLFAYELVQLLIVNVTGILLSYTLEHTARSEFLRSRLLEHLSARDPLTGLSNRRSFTQHLDRLWAQGCREGQTIGLLLLDVDFFKRYNDHYGHQAGDECLKKVGAILARLERRPLDMAARVGGEEFAVLTYAVAREYLEQLARQVIEEIRAAAIPHAGSGVSDRVTVSVGTVVTTPDAARSSKGLYQFADEMLFKAKELGRNRVHLGEQGGYESMVTGRFVASGAR
jgi:diguanylate cyclase (GGDEF)-like protein